AHPGIELHLTVGGSHLLIEQLTGGELDMALITTSDGLASGSTALIRTPLLIEELVVISSAAQPAVTDETTINLEQLSQLPIIAFHENYDLRVATDAAFRASGYVPQIVVEGAEMDAVLRFVERGLGVAVVPAMVLLERPSLRSVRLIDPQLTRTVSVAHRSDVNPTRAATAMRRTIVTTATKMAEHNPATLRFIDMSAQPAAD